MTSGQIATTGAYKRSGAFTAIAVEVTVTPAGGEPTTVLKYRSDELSGWVTGTPSAAGDTRNVSSGESFYSDSSLTTSLGTVSSASFFTLTKTATRGTVSVTAGRVFDTNFGIVGDTYTVRSSGYSASDYFCARLSSTYGGQTASASYASYLTFTPTNDTAVTAEVRPVNLTASFSASASGSLAISKLNASGAWESVANGGSFQYTQTLRITPTMASGKAFQSVTASADGSVRRTLTELSGGSAIFGFGLSDAITNPTVTFALNGTQKQGYSYQVQFDSAKCSLTVDGASSQGAFTAYQGETHTVSATALAGYRVTGIVVDGTQTGLSTYTFVQGATLHSISVAAVIDVTVYPLVSWTEGDSSSSYGPDTEAYEAGCRVTVTDHPSAAPSGQGRYAAGLWTLSYTLPIPEGASESAWAFLSYFVKQGSETYKVDGNTVYINSDTTIIGVFYLKSSSGDPPDTDQGNATATTSALLMEWEGGSANKTATWKGRRNVFVKPVSFSCAQVYANGYTSPATLFVNQFESPNENDSIRASTMVSPTSQTAVRLKARRPDKYVELEVSTSVEVTQIAVSTSMGGLWQQTT